MTRYLRTISFFAWFVILLSGCSITSVPESELVGKAAPMARFTMIDHTYHRLSEFKGKLIVLAFWDAHCSHCRQTMPKVEELARIFADEEHVVFLGISVNTHSDEQDLKDAIYDLSLNSMKHVFSGNDIYDETYMAFKGIAVPYLVLIDRAGIVRWIGSDPENLKAALLSAY